MTTATTRTSRSSGSGVLLGASAAAGAAALATVVVAGLTAGASGSRAAALGAGVVVVVSVLGTAAVDAVARLLPAAALLVALLTYVLQVLALAVFFAVVSASGALDRSLDRDWLGGSIIVVVLVWLVAQVAFSLRQRIPAFHLPEPTAERGGAS